MTTQQTDPQTTTVAHNDVNCVRQQGALRLKLKDYFHPDCDDAYNFAWAATRLHHGIRLENMADDEGNVCIEATIYEDVPSVACADTATWWPAPKGWPSTSIDRPENADLWNSFSDERWAEQHARAFLLLVQHCHDCCALSRQWGERTRQEWFVEFSGLRLAADLDYGSFPLVEISSSVS